jgi:ABC-type uncharacterized transport system involved in gliding motility auxiliary subunit
MKNTQLLTTSGLLVAVVLFLAINMASNTILKSVQWDLTDNKLYTLSDGSKNILTNLPEPITLRLYLSQKLVTSLPGINSYAVRVQELLEQYQRLAGDKLKLMVIDPEPFSEEEDRAEGYGLQGIPVNDSNTSFYFGLVGTNSTDDQELITFFNPSREEFLEYDVTQMVYRLANPQPQVVGIMSSLPIQGEKGSPLMQASSSPPWMIVDHLQKQFEIRPIDTKVEEIPKDIKVLLLVHPKHLGEETLYAIDQFVLKGGRLIVFVDPYSEAEQPPVDPNNPMAAMQAPRYSELTKLFDAWGIEMVGKKVVGDMKLAQTVQVRKGGNKLERIKYPVWMALNSSDFFNAQDTVTAKIGNMLVASSGALMKKGNVGTDLVPLMESSDQAMLVDTDKIGPLSDPEELLNSFKPEGKKFTLAARVTGTVKTAFPDGKPKQEETDKDKKDQEAEKDKDKEETPPLKESAEPINLIVVADTDLLEDQFWVRVQNFLGQRIALPFSANATFVSNAVDNLSGSNDLISVRNRGSFSRPFTAVEALQQEAEQSFREKEKKLQTQLQETDQKLRDLQNQKQKDNAVALTAEQQQEIARFRDEKIKIRKELRNVQHELQKNIEGLEGWMKFINIGLMPLLIGIGGIILSLYRSRRKRGLQPVKG